MKKTILATLIAGVSVSHSAMAQFETLASFEAQTSAVIEQIHQFALDPKNITQREDLRFVTYNEKEYLLNFENYPMFPLNDADGLYSTAFPFVDSDWEFISDQAGFYLVPRESGIMNTDESGCHLKYIPAHRSSPALPDGSYLWQTDMVHEVVDRDCTEIMPDDVNTTLEYFERGKTINGTDLALDVVNISAIEQYKDRLYVTNDTTPGEVIVLDALTGEKIDTINGIDSGLSAYKRINELHIDNNLLYVASLSSDRVDIYDLDNQHQHVMSLGTGKFSGSNEIHHAQSIVTSDDYVIAGDSSSTIKVYLKNDVIADNHFRAPHYAYLQFEGKYSHRQVQMHTLGHYLLVMTANKNYYIYDLNKIESAASAGELLQPEKRIDIKVQKIDKFDGQLVINKDDRIEWHNITDVIDNDFNFLAPTRVISSLNGQPIKALKDIHFTNDVLITATQDELRFDTLRSIDVAFSPEQHVDMTSIKFDQIMPTSITTILELDEPHHILTDPDLRSVKVNSPVKTEFFDKDTLLITNYAAVELKDISLELKLNSVDQWFTLAMLDRIPAYSQIKLPLSAFGDGQFNTSNQSGHLDLSNLFNSSMNYTKEFDYRFNSLSDTFAQKLASIKPTWQLRFAEESHGKWRQMNALYAREWLIILTNLAYMVSQEEFDHLWFNFEAIFGYNMNGNAGAVNEPGGFFTPEDYQYWYEGLMNRQYVKAGVTLMGGGQGNAHAFGVDTWMFYTHYYGMWGIIAHEFGHGFDGKSTYHHHTSFANGGNGWHPLITALANYHIRKGDLPYMDDEINGFYKPEHAPYQYVEADPRKRKHRADSHMYMLDDYFMTYSAMPRGWTNNGEDISSQLLTSLNNQERMLMATYPMSDEKPNLCRFTYNDGEQYFGYVEQSNEQSYCKTGNDISYRQADGTHVELMSKNNEFEWLSLYNPEKAGEPVLHQNGQPLCQINVKDFYGTGFVNANNQCTQLPNVYWSNGNRWTFSSQWTPLTYSSSNWTPPAGNYSATPSEQEGDVIENCN